MDTTRRKILRAALETGPSEISLRPDDVRGLLDAADERDAMREVLVGLQWGVDHDGPACPECDAYRVDGHRSDCALAAARAAFDSPKACLRWYDDGAGEVAAWFVEDEEHDYGSGPDEESALAAAYAARPR